MEIETTEPEPAVPSERILESVESVTKPINYSTNELVCVIRQFDKLTVIKENVCINQSK